MTSEPIRPTVVLVHAAWADASSWNKIIFALQRSGISVTAVQIPLTSLFDDVAAVRQVVRKIKGSVLLVGHSYGGAVITGAGSKDPNVKALVYIAGMAPDGDETVGELLHRAAPHPSAPALVPDEDGFLWMSAEGFANALAPDTSADAALMAATQKPIAVKCLEEQLTNPAWKEKPSWFVLARKDRMISPDTQRFMAERAGARIVELDVDHTPIASAPAAVVRVIGDAIDAVVSRSDL
jgi:pimeloyl-ACP methyl ester carboxylesterase